MASGLQHFIADNIINIASIPLIIAYPDKSIEILSANAVATLFTPDIDMERGTYNEIILAKFVDNKFSKNLVTNLQKTITAPYAMFIPHRSWLSHAPFVSTLTITFYLWCVYYILSKVIGIDSVGYLNLFNNYKYGMAIITIHYIVHTIMDGGMIVFNGKKKYIFGKPFYELSRKLFPQSVGT